MSNRWTLFRRVIKGKRKGDPPDDEEPIELPLDSPWFQDLSGFDERLQDCVCQDPSGRWVIDLVLFRGLYLTKLPHAKKKFRAYSHTWGPFSRSAISQSAINEGDTFEAIACLPETQERAKGTIGDESFFAETSISTDHIDPLEKVQCLWKGRPICAHWDEMIQGASKDQKLKIDIFWASYSVDCPLCGLVLYILSIWHKLLESRTSGTKEKHTAEELRHSLAYFQRQDSLQETSGSSQPVARTANDALILELQPGGFPSIFELFWKGNSLGKMSVGLNPNIFNGTFLGEHDGIHGLNAQLNTQYISHLLNHCCGSHAMCNKEPSTVEGIDILLIDVRTMSLVKTRSSVRYFALSYVWGGKEAPDARRSNIDALKTRGINSVFKELPAVMADAIALTRACGEQYLWVDKLCIVQDDLENKHSQIQQMDTIFSNATLTIISLSGENVYCSLPGLRPRTRAPIRLIAQYGSSVRLILDPMSPDTIIRTAIYETRGWTYQERLLSRRCLYFSDYQAFFQCREGSLTEAMWTSRHTVNIQRLIATGNEPNRIRLLNPLSRLWQSEEPGESAASDVWKTYTQLVRDYSVRTLSYPADILNAFAGVVAVLDRHYAADFVQGLPLRFLDLALFWYQRGKLERRRAGNDPTGPEQRNFPSWSWSGWVGPISYFQASAGQVDHAEIDIEAFGLVHAWEYRTSSQIQYQNKSPQYRLWTSHTIDLESPQENQPWVLTFSAASFGTSYFRASADPDPPKGHFPVTQLLDTNSYQCGVLFDGLELGNVMQGRPLSSFDSYLFIVLSYTKKTLSRSSGFTLYSEDGYIEPFGEEYSKLPGLWRRVNVMLIARVGDAYERVAVGMLHEKVLQDIDIYVESINLV